VGSAGHDDMVGHMAWRRHSTLALLSHLSPAEQKAVCSLPAASNNDDLRLFARYFSQLVPHKKVEHTCVTYKCSNQTVSETIGLDRCNETWSYFLLLSALIEVSYLQNSVPDKSIFSTY